MISSNDLRSGARVIPIRPKLRTIFQAQHFLPARNAAGRPIFRLLCVFHSFIEEVHEDDVPEVTSLRPDSQIEESMPASTTSATTSTRLELTYER